MYAASMLIPISVLLYTASGGLKATFTTSYAHTVIIYVALCLFTFMVYAGSKDMGIGSIDRVSPASLVLIPIRHVTPDLSKLPLWRLCKALRALSNALFSFSHTPLILTACMMLLVLETEACKAQQHCGCSRETQHKRREKIM